MGFKLFNLPSDERLLLVGAILLIYVAFRVVQFLLSRNKAKTVLPLGSAREYGLAGGAICPRCHRPIVLSLLGIKIGFGTRLVRCEFCGKWSIVGRASPDQLRAAEAAELADAQPAQPVTGKSVEEKEKSRIDESRFTDK